VSRGGRSGISPADVETVGPGAVEEFKRLSASRENLAHLMDAGSGGDVRVAGGHMAWRRSRS
jgi:hypothetical protein